MINRRDLIATVIAACATFGVVTLAQSDKPLMGSSAFDWNAIEAKPQKYGARREFFQGPTATLDELECHVTTLNPGESPHPPHKHPEEELMIVKEGTIEALVNGALRQVGPGSVIFQASNQLHGIRNVGQTPATYHVIRWDSPGMLKAKPNSDPRLPTLFVIGDSTVNNSDKDLMGWGTPIATLFDKTKIIVENRARGGRSSRTYITEGLWDNVLAEIRPVDFVLMQFGHNDGGAVNDNFRARGSLKGTGEETQEIDNLLTQKHEVVHTYGWYMRKYITDTKAKGATPIVLSPVPRNVWKDAKVARASADYGKWAAEVAKAEGAFFIDLNEIVAKHYEEAGPERVQTEFFTAKDHTHTSPAGARLNAASVVEGLRGLENCPLVKSLLAKP